MRNELREATGAVHARLDEAVGHMPLSTNQEYAGFLTAQHHARQTADSAFEIQPPFDLPVPPSQTSLIARDLQDLGVQPRQTREQATFPSPFEALGAAWVLAGSSLGNRAMLSRRRKAGLTGPERFLSDDRLTAYFTELLKVLDQPHERISVDAAIRGAHETFERFERAFAAERLGFAA